MASQKFYSDIELVDSPSGGVGTQKAASQLYVQSRLQNLVTNGNGLLQSNYNFSMFTYDPEERFTGGGSFTYNGPDSSRTADELIPVDVSRRYRFSYAIKLLAKSEPSETPTHYGYVQSLDADGLIISVWHIRKVPGSTLTTLAADLVNGATTVSLTDSTGWYDGAVGHQRTLAFYGYTNNQGYTYPDYTYTRNVIFSGTTGAWPQGGINYGTHTITLVNPYSGPTIPAGTAVANHMSGGSYDYVAGSNSPTPDEWTIFSGEIGADQPDSLYAPPTVGSLAPAANEHSAPSGFRWGTAFIQIGWLLSYSTAVGTAYSAIDAVTFELATNYVGGNLYLNDGSASVPALTFKNDTNVGLLRAGADSLAVTTGGTTRFTINTSTIASTLPITVSGNTVWHAGNDGAASGLDADLLDGQHGSYYQNAGNLNAGTLPDARLTGSYTGLTNLTGSGNIDFAKFLGNASDTAAAPSYSWTGDTDTGIWRSGADAIGISTGGVNRVTINSSGISGAGSGLTSLNASNLSSGTVAAARLPAFTGGDVTSSAGSVVLTLANSGVSAGTYTKVTVDAKGRVTTGASLSSGDLPSHTHSAADITSGTLAVARGGTGIASYTTNNYIRASGSTTLEQRTPAQVRSDIGAAASSHTHTAANISDFSEAVDDRVAALLVAGTNITLSYNDAGNTLTINSTASGGSTSLGGLTDVTLTSPVTGNVLRYNGSAWVNYADSNYLARANHTGTQAASTISDFAEAVSDQVGTMVTGNTESGISVVYQDADNTLDFTVSATLGTHTTGVLPYTQGGTGLSTAPGSAAMLVVDGVGTYSYIYGNAGEVLFGNGMASPSFQNFAEAVSDQVGTMVTGNTETGITVTYQDTDNTLDFAVTDSPLLGGQNSAYHLSRANHTGTQTASTISDFNSAAVSATASAYVDVSGDTMTGALLAANGTTGAPSISFASDPDTGLKWGGVANTMEIIVGGSSAIGISGTATTFISNLVHLTQSNSTTLPPLGFAGDTNTGIYRPAADQIGITTGGSARAIFSSAGIDMVSGQFLGVAADTVSAPSYSWSGDTNTGMYRSAADEIGFATGGVLRAKISNSSFISYGSNYLYGYTQITGNADVYGDLSAEAVVIGSDFDVEAMYWMQVAP